MITLNFTDQIKAAKQNKALNKPFRTPGGPKKFSVYVRNEKGNVVKVNFGDPNMEIKRDDPARRRNFRARHNCANPGPKWKARYWSCYQWRAGAPVKGSELIDAESEAKKGLWYNIQKKKERMGKNYKPAQPGDKDFPSQEALKKAQAGEEEWDGVTIYEQAELLKLWPELSKADDIEVEKDEEEMLFNAQESAEMAVTIFSAGAEKLSQLINAVKSDPMIAARCSDPWLSSDVALLEHYVNSIHGYLMYPKEGFASEGEMEEDDSEEQFKNGTVVRNINPACMHYGSEGVVESVEDLPNNMGRVIKYKVTNDGPNFKKGDILIKTKDQLIKAAIFNPPLLVDDKTKKLIEKTYKEVVEPFIEQEHGTKVGRFSEDDLEYQQVYEKTYKPEAPIKNVQSTQFQKI